MAVRLTPVDPAGRIPHDPDRVAQALQGAVHGSHLETVNARRVDPKSVNLVHRGTADGDSAKRLAVQQDLKRGSLTRRQVLEAVFRADRQREFFSRLDDGRSNRIDEADVFLPDHFEGRPSGAEQPSLPFQVEECLENDAVIRGVLQLETGPSTSPVAERDRHRVALDQRCAGKAERDHVAGLERFPRRPTGARARISWPDSSCAP